jgi:hypothetical protein
LRKHRGARCGRNPYMEIAEGGPRDLRNLSLFSDSRQNTNHRESQLAMASSLRLPAGSFASSARSNAMISPYSPMSQIRSFSQMPQRLAAIRSQNFNAKSQTQASMKARNREAMQMAQAPLEVQWLPGTFVRPLWRNTPSVFTHPKEAWKMQLAWATAKLKDFVSYGFLFTIECCVEAPCLRGARLRKLQ